MKALVNFALIAVLTLAFAPTFAHAQAPTAGDTLESVMDQMGGQMRVLVDALIKNKPVTDADLVAATDLTASLTVRADKILPKQLADAHGQPLPGSEADVAKYHDLMSQLVAALTELSQDVKAGDRAAAKNVLMTKVSPIQKEGHRLFKQD